MVPPAIGLDPPALRLPAMLSTGSPRYSKSTVFFPPAAETEESDEAGTGDKELDDFLEGLE